MNKKTIIRTFEKIALYMELLGENPFKVGAFRKAANVLELDPRSLSEMDDILKLKGIGKGTGAVIIDLMEKGESDLLKELEAAVPKGLIPLLKSTRPRRQKNRQTEGSDRHRFRRIIAYRLRNEQSERTSWIRKKDRGEDIA